MTTIARTLPIVLLSLSMLASVPTHANTLGVPAIAILSTRDSDNYDIYTMDPDGTSVTRLTDSPAAESGIAWSLSGGRIAFNREQAGNSDIYGIFADGTHEERLTDSPGDDRDPQWSPDGDRILFYSDRDGDREIFIMNSGGSGQTNLTQDPGSDTDAVWSPDGAKIAFSSDRDGDREIYVMDPDGDGLQQLTQNDADDCCAAWSADGTKIVFETDRDETSTDCVFGCNSEIYVMNWDGTHQTNLTISDGPDFGPVWSPDGTRIAFESSRNEEDPESCFLACNIDIYAVSADGTGQVNLTDNPARDTAPAWSPDGLSISFTTTRDEPNALLCIFPDCNDEIYVMDVDGSNPVPLTEEPRSDCCAAWQPHIRSGDADCDGLVDSVDALRVLRWVAAISDSSCMGAANVKCDDPPSSVDALFILRHVAQLPVNLPEGCPAIGT